MKVNIYGAGNNTVKYIDFVKKHFDVQYIFDMSDDKSGKEIAGIEIVKPNTKNVNAYPVLVLIANVNSAIKTLLEFGCKTTIYAFMCYMRGYAFYPCNTDWDIDTILDNTQWYYEKETTNNSIPYINNKESFVEGKKRVFDIASPMDFDAAGGPCACLRNLWLANEEYNEIENFITICPSEVHIPVNTPHKKREWTRETYGRRKRSFKFDNDANAADAMWLQITIWGLIDFLDRMNASFSFSDEDIFLLQDPYIVEAFRICFPDIPNVYLASHVQGTLSNELKKKYPSICRLLDEMQLEHLKKYKNWIFPANGAIEGFCNTATKKMKEAIKECNFAVAYNGYVPKDDISPDESFIEEMEKYKMCDAMFVSASFLYRNKGIERVPQIISKFKKKGLSVLWILIGNGEMEEEVIINIEKYLDEDDYIWYKNRFDNQDNVFALFSKADYYIMMHRVSVFDLSTLQAMSYKCIPILSNVGGNKELCGFDNGLLINYEGDMPLGDIDDEFIITKKLERLKEKNREVVNQYFNNKKFIEGYKNVIL